MQGQASARLKLVAIGGGTGLSTLLSGLKRYVARDYQSAEMKDSPCLLEMLTAVVTVTDDGGSSGRLREEFQILPPGDIRNCMVALSEDERLLARLFQYRFGGKGELRDHSFGNLFLTALTDVTGDFLEAIKLSSEVLAIKGRIFPSTMSDVVLSARLSDGTIVQGESNISQSRIPIAKLSLEPSVCHPLPETLDAIKEADIITLGPGSLFTSILPNLLVEGIPRAISSSSAVRIYICNIMTQPGETDGFTAEDHVRTIFRYAPELKLDYVLVNSRPISQQMKQKYLADGAVQVGLELFGNNVAAIEKPEQLSLLMNNEYNGSAAQVIFADLLEEKELVRHEAHKLSRLIFDIYQLDRAKALLSTEAAQRK